MKILHPTDFSECAALAEKQAVALAQKLGGEIVLFQALVEAPLYGEGLLNVREAQKVYGAQRSWAQESLAARAAELGAAGVSARWRVSVGAPYEEIVKAAKDEQVDMIVLGTHGRGGLNRLLLGSVAERVIRTAPCPVLTVRQTKGDLTT